MLNALVGGGLFAATVLLVVILKRSFQNGRRVFWKRSEMMESMISVGLVAAMAFECALILQSLATGWFAPVLGIAVAVVGSAAVVALTRPHSHAQGAVGASARPV